jgi:hypothetical protein
MRVPAGALRRSFVCAAAIAATWLVGVTRAQALPTITTIAATAGIHGHAYDAAPTTPTIPQAPYIPLAADGYAEHEFQMSGGATTYRQQGIWGSNGFWSAAVAQTGVPYTTRLLVRYPTNPAKFSGTVVLEWLNDTTGGDQDPVWANLYEQIIADGDAYVGVTAQNPGMADLRAWDPVRYGSLGDTSDAQSNDIFTQAAQAVRADSATLLGGLTPKRLIGAGDSQSAFRIVTYVNAIEPLTHAFNAFLAVGRSGAAAPIGSGLIAPFPYPALIRADNTAPFIQLNTEGDITELGAGASRQPDNNYLRTWELPGAAHIDAHEAAYEIETIARDEPNVPIPHCLLGTPIVGTGTPLDGVNQANNMPLYEVEHAALAALNRWLTTGVAPAHSPLISTDPVFFGLYDIVNHDAFGNALGGIRLPEIAVPAETYSPINFAQTSQQSLSPPQLFSLLQSAFTALETGSINNQTLRATGLCLLSGYFQSLPQSTLQRLYPTHANYVAKYTAGAHAAEAQGFLTPADTAASIARAQAAPVP